MLILGNITKIVTDYHFGILLIITYSIMDDIILTHFRPMFPFYTPWKRQKARGYRKGTLAWNGLKALHYIKFISWKKPRSKNILSHKKISTGSKIKLAINRVNMYRYDWKRCNQWPESFLNILSCSSHTPEVLWHWNYG